MTLGALLGLVLVASPPAGSLSAMPKALKSLDAALPTYYPTCAAAHFAGVYSIRRGEPGYRDRLDADGDGLACEPLPPAR